MKKKKTISLGVDWISPSKNIKKIFIKKQIKKEKK
jgi:hypothetical protein